MSDLRDRESDSCLTPEFPVRLRRWEVVGRLETTQPRGSDLLDFYAIDDDRCALSVVSVSGRARPLPMPKLRGLLREVFNGSAAIAAAMTQLKEHLLTMLESGQLAECVHAELDVATGVLRYCNAGSNFAWIGRRDGSVLDLLEGGLPLGIAADATYDEGELSIVPGDSLLLCTRGLPDALGSLFGVDRLRAIWQRCIAMTPDVALTTILTGVELFRSRASTAEVTALPTLQDFLSGDRTGPTRIEAEELRKRADQAPDIALIVLGSHQ